MEGRRFMRFVTVGGFVVAALLVAGQGASAQQFNSGIPAGWTCVANCGVSGANGVVGLAPGGGSQYGWVSTSGGVTAAGGLNHLGLGGETNGSMLTSVLFAGNIGDILAFNFNYVTSDGAGYADYAWVMLLDDSFAEVALLFTARTVPAPGNIVPGTDMPAPNATLTPSTVSIQAGTTWSPLGGYSGACYASGCGHSGWVQSNYALTSSGNFYLQFGVVNWSDQIYHSGLAFDGLTIGGVVIGDPTDPTVVPEPATMVLLATGLMGMAGAGFIRRRRQR
jgi:hypothetical protein